MCWSAPINVLAPAANVARAEYTKRAEINAVLCLSVDTSAQFRADKHVNLVPNLANTVANTAGKFQSI